MKSAASTDFATSAFAPILSVVLQISHSISHRDRGRSRRRSLAISRSRVVRRRVHLDPDQTARQLGKERRKRRRRTVQRSLRLLPMQQPHAPEPLRVAYSSSAALARSGPILANCFLDGSRLLVLSIIQLWHTDAVRAIHPSKPGYSDLRLASDRICGTGALDRARARGSSDCSGVGRSLLRLQRFLNRQPCSGPGNAGRGLATTSSIQNGRRCYCGGDCV